MNRNHRALSCEWTFSAIFSIFKHLRMFFTSLSSQVHKLSEKIDENFLEKNCSMENFQNWWFCLQQSFYLSKVSQYFCSLPCLLFLNCNLIAENFLHRNLKEQQWRMVKEGGLDYENVFVGHKKTVLWELHGFEYILTVMRFEISKICDFLINYEGFGLKIIEKS